jgi:hypothetical protein
MMKRDTGLLLLQTSLPNANACRLNQQNLSANAVRGGHILDPAIPKQNISRIADIATGTGFETLPRLLFPY